MDAPGLRTDPVAMPRGYFIALPTGDQTGPGLFDEALAALRRSWIVVAACTIAFGALALLGSILIPATYLSETVLAQPEESRTSSTISTLLGELPLPSLAGIGLDSSGEQIEALAILRSRAFTEQFIAEENLLSVLFADKWDAEKGTWLESEQDDPPTMEDAYKKFEEKVRTITQDPATGLITMSIEWRDRNEAARWANTLVQRVNERLRERAITEAQRSIDFLNDTLAKTSVVELRTSIYHLIEEQLSKIVVAKSREEYAFRTIDPAVPSDEDAYVWPNRILMAAIGLAFGMFLGVAYALLRPRRGSGGAASVRGAEAS